MKHRHRIDDLRRLRDEEKKMLRLARKAFGKRDAEEVHGWRVSVLRWAIRRLTRRRK
jgi:hypothetical protein